MSQLSEGIHRIGLRTRARIGAQDVVSLKRLMALSQLSEALGRVLLHTLAGPWAWIVGVTSLAFHLCMESQFTHAIMHGAYVGLPGAENLTPKKYETIAVPMRCKTWGDAHHIHHRRPSLLNEDPDTLHPLYRVHREIKWRWYHIFNTFLAQSTVFENLVFNYDKLLKSAGVRKADDRGDLKKFAAFIAYQYIFFPILAGENWLWVLGGNLLAVWMRNLVVSGLQMASSVGYEVSTRHSHNYVHNTRDEWIRFQVETSKNYRVSRIWRPFLGGLDKHIEHHLFPNLPPNRLYECSQEVRNLCLQNQIRYTEFASTAASLRDSLSYLQSLTYR